MDSRRLELSKLTRTALIELAEKEGIAVLKKDVKDVLIDKIVNGEVEQPVVSSKKAPIPVATKRVVGQAALPKAPESKASKATLPKASESKATLPKASESKATLPKASESKATLPKATEDMLVSELKLTKLSRPPPVRNVKKCAAITPKNNKPCPLAAVPKYGNYCTTHAYEGNTKVNLSMDDFFEDTGLYKKSGHPYLVNNENVLKAFICDQEGNISKDFTQEIIDAANKLGISTDEAEQAMNRKIDSAMNIKSNIRS